MPYVLSFAAAFLMSSLMVPLSRHFALVVGAVALPGTRHVHQSPMPRMGGLAVFSGFWAGALAYTMNSPQPMPVEMAGVFTGTLVLLLLGIYDDMGDAPVQVKLPVQIAAAHLGYFFGVRFDLLEALLKVPGWTLDPNLMAVATYVLTILWLVGVTNAMNFVDGLDGLASGITLAAVTSLLLVTQLLEIPFHGVFLVALLGAVLAFFHHNSHPASIFLGDTGSTFLGFSLGCFTLLVCHTSHASLGVRLIPILLLAVPLSDTLYAILRRLAGGANVFAADRGHLHHRLLDMGRSPAEVVQVMFLATLVMCLVSLFLLKAEAQLALLILLSVGLADVYLAYRLELFDPDVLEAAARSGPR